LSGPGRHVLGEMGGRTFFIVFHFVFSRRSRNMRLRRGAGVHRVLFPSFIQLNAQIQRFVLYFSPPPPPPLASLHRENVLQNMKNDVNIFFCTNVVLSKFFFPVVMVIRTSYKRRRMILSKSSENVL
jgi:hypothetical protein